MGRGLVEKFIEIFGSSYDVEAQLFYTGRKVNGQQLWEAFFKSLGFNVRHATNKYYFRQRNVHMKNDVAEVANAEAISQTTTENLGTIDLESIYRNQGLLDYNFDDDHQAAQRITNSKSVLVALKVVTGLSLLLYPVASIAAGEIVTLANILPWTIAGVSVLTAAIVPLVFVKVRARRSARNYEERDVIKGSWDRVIQEYNTARVEHLKAGTAMPTLYVRRNVIPATLRRFVSERFGSAKKIPAEKLIFFNVEEREDIYIIYRWAYTAEAKALTQVHNDAWKTTPQETVTTQQLRSAVKYNNKGIVVAQIIDKQTQRDFIGALIWSIDVYLTPRMIEHIRTKPIRIRTFKSVDQLTNKFTLKRRIDKRANARFNLSGNSPPVKAGMRAVPETQSLDKQSLKLKNKSSPLAVKPGISGFNFKTMVLGSIGDYGLFF